MDTLASSHWVGLVLPEVPPLRSRHNATVAPLDRVPSRFPVINQADEAKLVGVGLDNRQMVDGIDFECGR